MSATPSPEAAWTEQELELYAAGVRFADLRDYFPVASKMAVKILRQREEIARLRAVTERLTRQHFASLSKLDDENSRLRSELERRGTDIREAGALVKQFETAIAHRFFPPATVAVGQPALVVPYAASRDALLKALTMRRSLAGETNG